MKIETIKLIPASKYLFVEITTNTGIKGVGEVGVWGFLDSTAEVIDKFRDYLVGKDPFNIEDRSLELFISKYVFSWKYYHGSTFSN